MERGKALQVVAILLPPFLYSLYRFSIGAFVPTFETTYSIGDAAAGEVISASVGLVAVGVFCGGLLAQRYGDFRTIMAGLVVFVVFEAAVVLAGNLAAFSAVFLAASFGIGLVITPCYGIVAELMPRRRGLGVSIVSTAYSFGGFVGPSLVGFLLAYRGWDSPFIALAALGAVFTAFIAVMLLKVTRGYKAAPVAYLEALRNRAVVVLAVSGFFADLGFLVFVSWTPKYLISAFSVTGSGTATVDSVFGVGVGLGGVGALMAGVLFDRLGGRRSILISGALSVVSFLSLYLVESLALALAIILAAGFFSNTFWPLMTAMAQVSARRGQVTSATSVVQTAGFIGAFVGPGLAGLIGGAVSTALIASTVVPYLVFLVVIGGFYRLPRDGVGYNPAPAAEGVEGDPDHADSQEGQKQTRVLRAQERGDGRGQAVL